MKIRGDELQRFINEAWPEPEDDWYWDHDVFDTPDPLETYSTDDLGPVCYQGRGEDPTNGDGHDLGKLITRWRKVRDCDPVTVLIPRDRKDEILAAIKAAGASLA